MKRFAFAVVALFVLLLVLVTINTSQFQSRQINVTPVASVSVDEEAAAQRLAGALRFATISNADTSQVNWTPFEALHEYLREAFPAVHEKFSLEVVNDYALFYTWEGTQSALDPLVLLAHLDVVPVEPGTEDEWIYPPFAGHVDANHIWGRGTLDDKNGVLAILEAVSLLIDSGYQPERTVMLAFGHDEEVGGNGGAKVMAARLQEAGITPWLVLDEGGIILEDHPMPLEKPLALVGIAEKGYLSLSLAVDGTGGHSSMPARETVVGILSGALHRLSQSPFPGKIAGVSQQLFEYVGPEMSLPFKALFANQWLFGPVIVNQLSSSPSSDAILRTTIAPTMLKGSPKANVLPARAEAVVNFRIIPGETIESVTERVKKVIDDPRVRIGRHAGSNENPSVVSSTEDQPFQVLQQTIAEIFPGVIVAPYLVVGGTDAKHFSRHSSHVYRFLPVYFREGDMARMHGTNERISKADYANAIRFYHQLILNTTRAE